MPDPSTNPQFEQPSVGGPVQEGIKTFSRAPVLGDFVIRREIGRGGMGTVYEAWQQSLQRVVALKVLGSQVSASPKAILRFQREAQAAAKLHHTHIVPIFAQGEEDGIYFYAMEFVEGVNLHSMISAQRGPRRSDPDAAAFAATVVLPHAAAGRGQPPESDSAFFSDGSSDGSTVALDLVRMPEHGTPAFFNCVAEHMACVADALDYAHLQGVIHRDIKPHNLILGGDGRMRIMDFGLARLTEQPGVTITGEMVGSPLYMSPEQIRGGPGKIDQRTDIYSLGATLYEWLTLVPPFPGTTREHVISLVLSSMAPPLRTRTPALPVNLETITLKAIERDPARRYQSAGEMRDDLRRFIASRPIVARRAGLGLRFARFIGRHQVASIAAAALALAFGLSWSVRVNQKKAASERAVAVEATAAAAEAQEVNELLLNFVSLVQGGPASLAEAAIPLVQGMTTGEATKALGLDALATSPGAGPPLGTPAAVAFQVAQDYFTSVIRPGWVREPDGSLDETESHFREALGRWADGDHAGAMKLLEGYLRIRPDDLDAWELHVFLCGYLRRYDDMLSATRLLLGSPEHQVRGRFWRAVAFVLNNDSKRGAESLNELLPDPDFARWARTLRGLALLQGELFQEALSDFDDVLAESAETTPAMLGRALALKGLDRLAEGAEAASAVIDLESQNANALTVRGDLYGNLKDFAAAARDYQNAMDVAGRIPALLYRFTLAQMQLYQRTKVNSESDTTQDVPRQPIGDATSNGGDPSHAKSVLDRLLQKIGGGSAKESSGPSYPGFRAVLPRP